MDDLGVPFFWKHPGNLASWVFKGTAPPMPPQEIAGLNSRPYERG